MNQAVEWVFQLSHQPIPSGETRALYALLRIEPARGTHARLPMDLYLVLDRSASMTHRARKGTQISKLDLLKEAAAGLIGRLQSEDRLAILAFDDATVEVSAFQAVASEENRSRILADLEKLSSGRGTHLSGALERSLRAKPADPAPVRRLLLLTDGEVNHPSAKTEAARCRQLADEAGAETLPFTVLGLGAEYNERLLGDLAHRSGGTWLHLSRPEDMAGAFEEQLHGLAGVVATDLELRLDLTCKATFQSVSRVVPEIQPVLPAASNLLILRLGNLDAARGQSLLVNLKVEKLAEGRHRLGTARLTYDLPSAGLRGLVRELPLEVEASPDVSRQGCDAGVLSTARFEGAHRLQTVALERLQRGERELATRMLDQVAQTYHAAGQPDLAAGVRTLSMAVQAGSDATSERRTLTTASKLALTRRREDAQ